jgi:enoyl-CoA hydratase
MSIGQESESVNESPSGQVRVSVESGVAWLTLDNPRRLNALSFDMLVEMRAAVAAVASDPLVRAVVVRGAGEKAFASGADISELAQAHGSAQARARYDAAVRTAWNEWRALLKPVVAMIRGYCLGGGLALALEADIRICSADSSFGLPVARLGAGYHDIEPLMATVSPAWASDILFTGRRLTSAEALTAGLVSSVEPADRLEAKVRSITEAIAANAPLTVKAAKLSILDLRKAPQDRDPEAVRAAADACFSSHDFVEGAQAFRDRREPRFEGR